MNTSWVAVAALALGLLLGVGTTVVQLGWRGGEAGWDSLPSHRADTMPALAPAGGAQPNVQVDQREFDFGALGGDAVGSHSFRFTNRGDYPLELGEGPTSCRCTLSQVPTESIPPGASAYVTLKWRTRGKTGRFREVATVYTNDPKHRSVDLTITGRITQALEIVPPELVFSKVPYGQSDRAQVRLLSYQKEALQLLDAHMHDPQTAAYFEVAVEPIPAAELADADAQTGLILTVTVKPGLPAGRFQQQLDVTLDLGGASTLEVPIQGLITSDISIVGPGWNAEKGILTLGSIDASTGLVRKLMIFVRGEDAGTIRFEQIHTDPEWLQVEVGEKDESQVGRVLVVPLVISVPPGRRSANFLGTGRSQLAEILIRTNHPRAKELRLLVSFAIENQ